MKKQDNNPIDNFFKENIHQDFPFDPALWNMAEKGIASANKKKYRVFFYILALLLISGTAFTLFLISDSKNQKLITSQQNIDINKVETSNENTENSGHLNQINIESSSTKFDSKNANKKDNKRELKQNQNQSWGDSEIASKVPSNESNSAPNNNNADDGKSINEKEVISNGTLTIINKNDNEVEKSETNTNFEIFQLTPKSIFNYAQPDQKTGRVTKEIDLKIKKLRMSLELEYLGSTKLTQQLKQVSDEFDDYKTKYETPQQYNSYSLNYLIKRNRLLLITGIGWAEANTKAMYSTDTNHVELIKTPIATYRMVRDSIPYQGGFYSKIKVFNDTLITKAEPLKDVMAATKWQWISIPLKVGYQYPIKRVRLAARVGADLMWLYRVQGSVISNNLVKIISIKDLEPKKFNIATTAQLMVGYQLHRKWQVGGSYYINKQLGSNLNLYNQRFSSQGFGFYLRWMM